MYCRKFFITQDHEYYSKKTMTKEDHYKITFPSIIVRDALNQGSPHIS